MATAGGYVETVTPKRVLLENGANMHTHQHPLFVAASAGRMEAVRALLVELGTDVLTQYAAGITSLHVAAGGGHTETACLR
jgi:hypothetical protein